MGIERGITEYPGRGLALITDATGVRWWLYFVTGRSASSRRRRVRTSNGGLVVESVDALDRHDPLRHYTCARYSDNAVVIGNGDHVDVIVDGLNNGQSIDQIVETIEPEPDPPIWTPRIALVVSADAQMISVHRAGQESVRRVHRPSQLAGSAAVLTTYSGSADAVVADTPFVEVEESRSVHEASEALFFEHLDQQLRVLLIAGRVERSTPLSAEYSYT